MKKIVLSTCLFVSVLFLPVMTMAQPPLAWANAFTSSGSNPDEARSIAVDTAGNVYVTGSAFNDNGNLDAVTIKYSPSGQQLWVQRFNGTGNDNDEAQRLVLDSHANVYVVGYTKGISSAADMLTIKYNSNGVQLWEKAYNGPTNNYDEGNAIAVDPSGNVYSTGYTTDTNYTYNFVTVKYDSSGNQQWAQIYDGPGHFNDESRDIGLDSHGNVYVTGPSDTFYNAQPVGNIVLLKYNNNGVFQWRKVYDPGFGQRLAIDKNDNIICTGYGFVTGNGNDIITMKYDSSGNFIWLKKYNYAANTFELPYDIKTDSLNNVVITGQGITSTALATNDYVTIKYDPSGNLQWASRYDGYNNGDDHAYALAIDDSLNIYVTGTSAGNGTHNDIATVKYDPAGNQVWAIRYDRTPYSMDDQGNDITVQNGDVYVTGIAANASDNDYMTLRYSYSATGIPHYDAGEQGSTVYPNPSNGKFSITIPGEKTIGKKYSAVIYNSIGQEIQQATPVLTSSNSAGSVYSIDAGELAAGYYFVRVLSENNSVAVSKFVVY